MSESNPSIEKRFLFFTLAVTLIGLSMIIGSVFLRAGWRQEVLKTVGAALIAVGLVEVAHDRIVSKKLIAEFVLLGDRVCGLERVCDPDAIGEAGVLELIGTNSLKALVLGGSWLFKPPNKQALEKLLAKCADQVQILVPDPCSEGIRTRYNDEPEEKGVRGMIGLALNIEEWWRLKNRYPGLVVKAYKTYPVAIVTIYDNHVYFGPVLHKRRNIENLTAMYKNPSRGASLYMQHFNNLFADTGNTFDLTEDYVNKVKTEYTPPVLGRSSSI